MKHEFVCINNVAVSTDQLKKNCADGVGSIDKPEVRTNEILFVSTAVFLQCTWISPNFCLVRRPVVCHTLYIICFQWFELQHILFFLFKDCFPVTLRVMLPLCFVFHYFAVYQ